MIEIEYYDNTEQDKKDYLAHMYCCAFPDMSYCGIDISGWPEVNDSDIPDCIVCVELSQSFDCPFDFEC